MDFKTQHKESNIHVVIYFNFIHLNKILQNASKTDCWHIYAFVTFGYIFDNLRTSTTQLELQVLKCYAKELFKKKIQHFFFLFVMAEVVEKHHCLQIPH